MFASHGSRYVINPLANMSLCEPNHLSLERSFAQSWFSMWLAYLYDMLQLIIMSGIPLLAAPIV